MTGREGWRSVERKFDTVSSAERVRLCLNFWMRAALAKWARFRAYERSKRVEISLRMSESYLESHQLSLQVSHSFRKVVPRPPIRGPKSFEFLDDDLGFVHLGLFS